MTRIAATLFGLTLLLSACEALPPGSGRTGVATAAVPPAVVPPPLNSSIPPVMVGLEPGIDPATGLDRAAVVNIVPATNGLGIYYRAALVTDEALREVPPHVCNARGAEVVSATTRDPQNQAELPGIKILAIQCSAPPAPPPAVLATTASPETAVQKGPNP